MSHVVRPWFAFAAIGAGILHLALVISSPLPVGLLLLVFGVAELGWAVGTLLRNRFVMAQVARVAALAPLLLWGTLLLASGPFEAPALASALIFVPMAAATVFDLAIAIALSISLRTSRVSRPVPPTPAAWKHVAGLFVGALAVSLLMTPALALTEAGLKNPHATHRPMVSDVDFRELDHPGHRK